MKAVRDGGVEGSRLYQTFENLENKMHTAAFTEPSLATTDLVRPPPFFGSRGSFLSSLRQPQEGGKVLAISSFTDSSVPSGAGPHPRHWSQDGEPHQMQVLPSRNLRSEGDRD